MAPLRGQKGPQEDGLGEEGVQSLVVVSLLPAPPCLLSHLPPHAPSFPTAMSIQKIHAREILDSRGNPTVEVDLHTAKGE